MSETYEGTCYIGIVGPEQDYGQAWRSILAIQRREGDGVPAFFMGTKGYELRQAHVNNFMDSDHAFLLLLDHDMIFPVDTLERLRGHGLPFVSGLYMRRQYNPMAPIWFEPNDGQWPMRPWTSDPEPGKLHEIGASGWGCMLVHREVIQEARKVLRGEPEIIEDDMDVWPYDLAEVLAGREQLRPLRGSKDPVGSDIRFPFYAKVAGYQLMGDPDVRPTHLLHYPLSPDDFSAIGDDYREQLERNTSERVDQGRGIWHALMQGFGVM